MVYLGNESQIGWVRKLLRSGSGTCVKNSAGFDGELTRRCLLSGRVVTHTPCPSAAPSGGDGCVCPWSRWCADPEVASPGLQSSTRVYEKGKGASELHAQIWCTPQLAIDRYRQLLFGLPLKVFQMLQSRAITASFACVCNILELSGLKHCNPSWLLPNNPLQTCKSKLWLIFSGVIVVYSKLC